ncbi:MAG: hypothetical protein WCG80_14710 [Spirochaetales bacterium]
MKHLLLTYLLLAFGATALSAQQEFSLDDVASTPAPTPARSRMPAAAASSPAAGGIKTNLYADADLRVTVPFAPEDPTAPPPSLTFLQNHTAILLKALYNGDQASMIVDALHADSYFELGVNGSLLGPDFLKIPVLGTSSFRFGRMLVPFGDFEFHHLYGGYVDESGLLFNKLWSDLGVSWKLTLLDGLESELFVGNGFGSTGSNPAFQSASQDNNLYKAVVERFRWQPTPATYVLLSGYLNQWGANDKPENWLYMAGLDAGTKLGPVGLKAGGFFNQNFGATPKDYFRYAWYAETKYTFDSALALRLRGGSMNPDSRAKDDTDQANANLALLWNVGPLAFEFMYSFNQETYFLFDSQVPNNYHQLLIKCLLNL